MACFSTAKVQVSRECDAILGDSPVLLDIRRWESEVLVGQRREAKDEAAAGVEGLDRGDVRSCGDVGYECVGFGL